MFNGLASFFFGAVGGDMMTATEPSPPPTSSSSSSNGNYTTVEAEGDWLLVESSRRRSAGGLGGGNCIDVPSGALTAVAVRSPPPSAPSSPTSGITLLDGSWYITPPPCFTADSPANVETSPMENLLIEHPSMSVYASCANPTLLCQPNGNGGRNGRRKHAARKCAHDTSLAPITANVSNDIVVAAAAAAAAPVESEMPLQESINGNDQQADMQPAMNNPVGPKKTTVSAAAVAAREELLLHVEIQAHSQKAIRERDNRVVHRRQLERHNKVQEYQSLGKRQRRKDFMKNHSGANNNRKC